MFIYRLNISKFSTAFDCIHSLDPVVVHIVGIDPSVVRIVGIDPSVVRIVGIVPAADTGRVRQKSASDHIGLVSTAAGTAVLASDNCRNFEEPEAARRILGAEDIRTAAARTAVAEGTFGSGVAGPTPAAFPPTRAGGVFDRRYVSKSDFQEGSNYQ